MSTLKSLKHALKQEAKATTSSPTRPLSESQYSAGFDILMRGLESETYENFIVPQLSQLIASLCNSHNRISILEIGPGPESVLGRLPRHLREKIETYTAFEPNGLFATRLREWLRHFQPYAPLPGLESPPNIHQVPFGLPHITESDTSLRKRDLNEKYDIVLFCHSMYGMKPKHRFVQLALEMLVERPKGGMVVIFHRDEAMHLDGLVCHRISSFPTGVVSVTNRDEEVLDLFASFVAGYEVEDVAADKAVRTNWRNVCRALGRRDGTYSCPDHLCFSSPNVMVAFTQYATALPALTAQVPLVSGNKTIKNREARLHHPAAIVRPTGIHQIRQCVGWALKHRSSLAIVGGGHSDHCLWSHAVSVDMGAFTQVHILTAGKGGGDSSSDLCFDPGSLIVAEGGCTTGDIIRKAMAAGVTVPLGSRPSVGAGLWLQGGIGHLARLHGLACDAIVGAVMVSVDTNQILCVGCVPSQHWPAEAVRPKDESDLLWAIKGGGTNFGIVVSVILKSYAAPTYWTRNWIMPLSDNSKARLQLRVFDEVVARQVPGNCSVDAYLYWEADQLYLAVAMVESSQTGPSCATPTPTPTPADAIWGPGANFQAVDGVGLFSTEMYVTELHGGHSGGKTSAFKRCIFLRRIGEVCIADRLVAAAEARPTPLCYLHLLHGGGAVSDVAADATAFGCRNWDFACVITGVWPRDQDGTEAARSAVQWVYDVVGDLLPFSSGAYGADLGPDPRDAVLAARAFGPNRPRLARLKLRWDPHNVLAYACPLPKVRPEQQLIILVTGDSCTGKDYCAAVWASAIRQNVNGGTVRSVSISDTIKRQYAAATGADLSRLLSCRRYKEHHRPALTEFYRKRVRQQPQMLKEQFLNVVHDAMDVDVLLITGMRDEAPVATLSYLMINSRLLEVHVQASEETRRIRRGCLMDDDGDGCNRKELDVTALTYRPNLIFDNDMSGDDAAEGFARRYLLPFVHEDMRRLAKMVRQVSDFPRPGIEFSHVLGIAQHPGGLALCTSLLQSHFVGDWAKVDAIATCEIGGLIYASALASRVDVPLVLMREAGKLPPPTLSIIKPSSYISSLASHKSTNKRIEMERDVIFQGASVVVVDDVLSTGKTLSAVLQLLDEAGVGTDNISIMVVAELPLHRGRDLLRQRGFGRINIQNLLVLDGA